MRAVSATVGIEAGAVRALAAGADALCIGADVDEALVTSIHRTIVDAVRSGRLEAERLHEAAGRIGELATWAAAASPGPVSRGLGAEAAKRALVTEGDVRLSAAPLVVELRPTASIAAGQAQHGLADVLKADSTVVSEGMAAPQPDGRPLVIVVRDAHRHAWEREIVEQLLAASPDAVVVEVGIPVWRPEGAAWIATHGGGRVNFEAAARALSPETVAV
jgi:hypothetical protein